LKVTEAEARTARAEANIEHLKQNMNAIGSKTVFVSADTSGAIASIQRLVDTPALKYVQVVTLNGPAPSGGKAAATGGPIFGPGTGTSDSIPARLSNGEYVINARQAARHRALLDAINYGAPGFAAGGPVLTAAQRRAVARQSNARTSLQFTVDNQDLPRFAASVTQTANTIRTAMQKLISDVRTGAQRGLGSSVLIGTLQRENTRLQHLANERAALSTKLKAADQRLVDARKAFQDEATTVANATRSGFSFTGTQFADSADLIGSLSSSVNQAGTFSRDLAALRKRHAAKSIVQQLAEAGAGSAGTTAHTLATASASDLRRINGLNSQLGVFSNAIGQGEARQLFGAGVDSAKGFALGLESQLSRVKSAASKIAKAVERQIRVDLKTHSPSKVTARGWAWTPVAGHAEGHVDSGVRPYAGRCQSDRGSGHPGNAVGCRRAGAGAGGVIRVEGVLKDERGDVVATLTQVGQQLTYGRNI
jgi:hypothetical protein